MVQSNWNGDPELLARDTSKSCTPCPATPGGQDQASKSLIEDQSPRYAGAANISTSALPVASNRNTVFNLDSPSTAQKLSPLKRNHHSIPKPNRGTSNVHTGQKRSRKELKKRPTSTGRGATFTEKEIHSLLDVLEQELPIGADEWDALTAIHKTSYPDENRSTDSLRRNFALLYRKAAPTGDPRIPLSVQRAKKIRKDMTVRIDLGDVDDSGVDGVFSGEEYNEQQQTVTDLDQEKVRGEDEEAALPQRSDTPSANIPTYPIVHKRARRVDKQDMDVLEIFKASILQEREYRIAERERTEREREEAKERRQEEARIRQEQREEERKIRHEEREEARKQREEDRQSRNSFMQMFMMFLAKRQGPSHES